MNRGKCCVCNKSKDKMFRFSIDGTEIGRYCMECGREKVMQIKERFGWYPEIKEGYHPASSLGYKKIKEIFC